MSIDRKTILSDLLNLSTSYLSTDVDRNIVSTYGYLTDALSKSIYDTIVLNRNRAKNSIIELSDDEYVMRTVAKIREISIGSTVPAEAGFILMIKISDILERGKVVNVNERQVIIDRRSVITCNGINFALVNDIAIRATTLNGEDVISANYINAESVNEFIHTYYLTSDDGSPSFGLLVDCQQIKYNIAEKTVTDRLQFTYDGIPFYYDNSLAGIEVQYRKNGSETYTTLSPTYYQQTTTSTTDIFFNDDRDGVVYIMNNTLVGIEENSDIRCIIKESIGEDGNFFIGTAETYFEMYRDDSYDYSGINIDAKIMSDSIGGLDQDTIEEVRAKLIDNKFGEESLTDRDIERYLGTYAADTYAMKKRNDVQDRLYNYYTIIRDDSKIAMPTTTMRLKLKAADFDVNHQVTQRKVLKCNNQFSLIAGSDDTVQKVSLTTPEEIATHEADVTKLLLNLPFTAMLNADNTITYYYANVDKVVNMKYKYVNEFPYQFLTKSLKINRNAISKTNDDKFNLTVDTILNTPDNIGILDEAGEAIIDASLVKCILFAYDEAGKIVTYSNLNLTAYDKASGKYTFTGGFTTNDYITLDRKLEMTSGFKKLGTELDFLDVLPYSDVSFDLAFMYKQAPASQNHTIYTDVPGLSGYSICSIYKTSETFNLVSELNRFMRSPVTLTEEESVVYYTLNEVPFIKYSYSLANQDLFYKRFTITKDTYLSMVKKLSDFEINMKFVRTYGESKYLQISGVDLANLNPVLKFKIYGKDVSVDTIRSFIATYLNSFGADTTKIFISNICTSVEKSFSIRSCEYLGIDLFNSTHQLLEYITPSLESSAEILAYVPEYMNIGGIELTVVDTY